MHYACMVEIKDQFAKDTTAQVKQRLFDDRFRSGLAGIISHNPSIIKKSLTFIVL